MNRTIFSLLLVSCYTFIGSGCATSGRRDTYVEKKIIAEAHHVYYSNKDRQLKFCIPYQQVDKRELDPKFAQGRLIIEQQGRITDNIDMILKGPLNLNILSFSVRNDLSSEYKENLFELAIIFTIPLLSDDIVFFETEDMYSSKQVMSKPHLGLKNLLLHKLLEAKWEKKFGGRLPIYNEFAWLDSQGQITDTIESVMGNNKYKSIRYGGLLLSVEPNSYGIRYIKLLFNVLAFVRFFNNINPYRSYNHIKIKPPLPEKYPNVYLLISDHSGNVKVDFSESCDTSGWNELLPSQHNVYAINFDVVNDSEEYEKKLLQRTFLQFVAFPLGLIWGCLGGGPPP